MIPDSHDRKPVPLNEIAPEVLVRGGVISFIATGASMWPHIRPGDVITVEPGTAGEEPRVGWVVMYPDSSNRLLLHRVVGRDGSALMIRGDAVAGAADIVARSSVLGRAVLRRRAGRTVDLTGLPASLSGWLVARSGAPRVYLERMLRHAVRLLRKHPASPR